MRWLFAILCFVLGCSATNSISNATYSADAGQDVATVANVNVVNSVISYDGSTENYDASVKDVQQDVVFQDVVLEDAAMQDASPTSDADAATQADVVSYQSDVNGVATAEKLSLMIDQGDLDESGILIIPANWKSVSDPGTSYDIFSAITPEGSIHLGYDWAGTSSYTLTVRGVQVLSSGTTNGNGYNANWSPGDILYWHTWYRPSIHEFGLQLRINGSYSIIQKGQTTGGALLKPTAAWIGSREGNSRYFAGTHSNWISHGITDLPTDPSVKIVVSGDSIYASYVNRPGFDSTFISNTDPRAYTDLIYSQSVPGETIANQQARYASAKIKQDDVKIVVAAAAINDLSYGYTELQVANRKISEIATIHSVFKNAKVIGILVQPCHQAVINMYNKKPSSYPYAQSADELWQQFQNYNNDLLGTGPNPIPGLDDVITEHWGKLDSEKPGYLNSEYEMFPGEGMHTNFAAELILGKAAVNVLHKPNNGALL